MQMLSFDLLLHILQDCTGASVDHMAEWLDVDTATISRHMNQKSKWRRTKELRSQWMSAFEKCRKEVFGNDADICSREICKTIEIKYSMDTTLFRAAYDQGGYGEFVDALVSAAWRESGVEKVNDCAKNAKSNSSPSNVVRIACYQELLNLGMTPIDIAKRLVENDYNLYPETSELNEGSPELWSQYLASYPETFRYLLNDDNEIVGNWSFLSVSEAIGQRIDYGDILESEFDVNNTEFVFLPGDYIGYLLNLSINDQYNTARNYNLLFEALFDQMLDFAKQDIFFKAWYVNVFRKDHEAMYMRIGFSYQCKNVSFGKIYKLDLTKGMKGNIGFINPELRMLYREHFKRN